MTVPINKRAMNRAFEQMAPPTFFLTNFFRTTDIMVVAATELVLDVRRKNEPIAVDIARHAGGRGNKASIFDTHIYKPPLYNENSYITGEDLEKRMPGQTEWHDPAVGTQVQALVLDRQLIEHDKIVRSVEYLSSQAMFTGVIILINTQSLDFKQKATHRFDPAVAWSNVLGKPLDDFAKGGELNRKDGKSNPDIAIFGSTAWQLFLANAQIKENVNFRRAKLIDINPPVMNVDGATFHGMITVGSYEVQAWTYPQFYDVPLGFGLPNEGTTVPYVPVDMAWIGNSKARFDLMFAGVPVMVGQNIPALIETGIGKIPANMAGKFVPYGYTDMEKQAIKIGVMSAPLPVPVDIDSFCVIENIT